MTLETFFEYLKEFKITEDLIVQLRCRMENGSWEYMNEILFYNGDIFEFEWLNDWDEGWDEKEVVCYVTVDHVFDRLKDDLPEEKK